MRTSPSKMKEIVFAADFFSNQVVGGAELTLEALIEQCTFKNKKINCSNITKKFIDDNSKSFWIFGNNTNLSEDLKIYIIKKIQYSVIEFDYKFCDYRSLELHKKEEGVDCDCQNRRGGKIHSIFLANSKSIWWMSQKQKEIFHNNFLFLSKTKNYILNSVFDNKTINFFNANNKIEKNNKYLILDSGSWIKSTNQSIKYAEENKLDYELIKNLSHEEILNKLKSSKGLIFIPSGADTCPRITIEAFLLDCELILNENVQHKDEEWFSDKKNVLDHLFERKNFFWDSISQELVQTKSEETSFKIIVTCRNAEETILKTINSIKDQRYKNFVCVISDDYSTDSTCKIVKKEIKNDERFYLIENKEQSFPCKNTEIAIESINDLKDEDVIFVLGGDDWLPDSFVLSKLSSHYEEEKCWSTFGSWWTQDYEKNPFYMQDYPDNIKKLNDFRSAAWVASSPRTFKAFLWKKILKEDLKDSDKKYYSCATDFAYFIPILEMCGEKSYYVNDILYTYNRSTPLNMDKIYPGKQLENEFKIRKKKRYLPIGQEYPVWSIACISYNDAKNLERFLFSCVGTPGLDDIFVIDHRSDDNTQEVLQKMKMVCQKNNVQLRWQYCEKDFSKSFTMADLRMMSVNGCKNELVSIQDADNLIGPNMAEVVRKSSLLLKEGKSFGVAYPLPVVFGDISFDENRVIKHGECIVHPPIPRILLKDSLKCEQIKLNGRYYWWGSNNKERDNFIVIDYIPSSNISLSFRDSNRQKLRSVMGNYFEKIKNNEKFLKSLINTSCDCIFLTFSKLIEVK